MARSLRLTILVFFFLKDTVTVRNPIKWIHSKSFRFFDFFFHFILPQLISKYKYMNEYQMQLKSEILRWFFWIKSLWWPNKNPKTFQWNNQTWIQVIWLISLHCIESNHKVALINTEQVRIENNKFYL